MIFIVPILSFGSSCGTRRGLPRVERCCSSLEDSGKAPRGLTPERLVQVFSSRRWTSYTQTNTHVFLTFCHFASHRWRNADKDMLCCLTCGAVVAVILPSGLSVTAMDMLCAAYRTRLAQAHHSTCTFRLQAEQYIKHQMNEAVLPTAFASIFPQDEVELLEHTSPAELLRARVGAIQDQCEPPCILPKLEIPHELHEFLSSQEGQSMSLLDHVAESGVLGTNQTNMVALAVLGWRPTRTEQPTGGTGRLAVSLHCPLCLADIELLLVGAGEKEFPSDSRNCKRKQARYCNPYDAHRYYCPFICGFPSTLTTEGTPLWKVLLKKMEETTRSRTIELDSSPTETTQIRAIIQSGIRPQKVEH